MFKKRKFNLPYYDGLIDVYLNGMKVHAGHPGQNGQIYFHISPDENPDVDIAPHDNRIGLEGEVKNGKVVKLSIERKFVKADVDAPARDAFRREVVATVGEAIRESGPVIREAVAYAKKEASIPVSKPVAVTADIPRNDEPVVKEGFKKAESNVGFSQEATVEVVKGAVEPKSLEDYASK
jgi:hypothetical protein